MSTVLELNVEGIGLWGPGLAGWAQSLAALRGEVTIDAATAAAKPAPPLLPPAERRRAPETVLFAAQVAAEACAMAGRDPASLPCVFASTQGDVEVTDIMCSTLARAPQELSPIKFHNSVHNAAVGYWTIATGCRAASTALSAWTDSYGAALLEAAVQAIDGQCAVLLAVYDSASVGPLLKPIPHSIGFASALVITPASGSTRSARLSLRIAPAAPATLARQDWAQQMRARNASAAALPLLEALALATPSELLLAAGPQHALAIRVRP